MHCGAWVCLPRISASRHRGCFEVDTLTRNSQLAKLTPQQMETMIKFAARRPSDNYKSITNSGLPTLGLDPLATGMVRAVIDNRRV